MKRNQTFFKVFGAAIIAAALASGCSDMTAQQYHDSEVQKQFVQCQAAAGDYVGTINSLDTGAPVGTFEFSPTCSTNNVNSPDDTSTDSQVVVTGSVQILGATVAEASFTGGYAPDTQVMSGTITISDETPALTMSFYATIQGSTMTGKITSEQYSNDGGSFTATLNGTPSTAQGSSSGQAPSYKTIYAGSGTGPDNNCTINGNSCDVTMTIDDTPSSSADAFGDDVVRVSDPIINLSIKMDSDGNLLQYSFGGTNGISQQDKRNGVLWGKSPSGNNSTDVLNCTAIGAKDGSGGYECNIDKVQFRVTPSEIGAQ